MDSIYICATGQDVGKTTTSLGISGILAERGLRVRFMKPVGQQYVELGGGKIDKDAVLVQSALRVEGELVDMSPITVPRGFVENYLFNRDAEPLKDRIFDAYERLKKGADIVVVEGTGHAGVGSCFDLSNADVAALLGMKVLLVAEGGIGSTLDQVALNVSLFHSRHVELLGVIANKVFPDKRERIAEALKQGLANMNQRFLGAIPFDPSITYPHVAQIAKVLKAEVLCGDEALGSTVDQILVAAMEPQNVLPRITGRCFMITPGDRIDNILVALNSRREDTELNEMDTRGTVVGLALTGNFLPHFTVVQLLKDSPLPVLLCKEDTYEVSAHVQGRVFKMMPEDTEKIALAQRLVRDYVDIDALVQANEGT